MHLNRTEEFAYHDSIQSITGSTLFAIACSLFVQVTREIVNIPLNHEAINTTWLVKIRYVTLQNTQVQEVLELCCYSFRSFVQLSFAEQLIQ